jgi:hypothetical protein
MKLTVLNKYWAALQRGDVWAVQWGLKHMLGFTEDNATKLFMGSDESHPGIKVTFVKPDPSHWKDDPMPSIELTAQPALPRRRSSRGSSTRFFGDQSYGVSHSASWLRRIAPR